MAAFSYVPAKGTAQNDHQSIWHEIDAEVLSAAAARVDCRRSGCVPTQQGSPDMTVACSAGTVLSAGILRTVAAGNWTVGAADATNPRIDLLVVTAAGALAVRAGTAAAAPKPPARTANDVVCAHVYVPATDTTITDDQLSRAKMADAQDTIGAPTVVSVGSAFSGTGVPTATFPGTHALNDILVLVLQQSNQANVTAPAGYKQIGAQNGIGAAAAAGSTKLSVFWKRDNGAESVPTIPDTGDHTYGVMFAVRGCPTTGDPFRLIGTGWKFTTSTAGSGPTGNTKIDNTLVLTIFAHGVDSASAQASAAANASLTSVTEEFDGSTTDGTGGGIVVVSGVAAAAGDVSATTLTWANTTVDVSLMIAAVPAAEKLRPAEKWIYIGSEADLDDNWPQPSGLRSVRVQLCDGGGGGSGGNTTTTAAGGGGGGGGGYAEAEYRPEDLAAVVTVHAGRGGNVGTALNQAGSAGVLSEFDKGNRGPLTSTSRVAGTAATAAASADGGNGGCGSGAGITSPAVAGTRISIEAATAGAAYGGVGGRGGSGTTAPTGGSPAYEGGGGGESGGDTDAALTSNNNGWSVKGAGGGSGGRTNTNISGSGHGGGAAGVNSAQGAAGTNSAKLPYGGSGGVGGGSSVATGGPGGFPGGGGGGGGGVAGGFGGRGGHGCVVVTAIF